MFKVMKHTRFFLLSLALMGALLSTSSVQASEKDLLTPEERAAFAARLSHAADSAQRARIKSEMNRLVQQRKLERRKQGVQKQ